MSGHKQYLVQADSHAEGFNPLCGDQLSVYLKLDSDCIVDASFQGNGCAICMASASMMTDFLKNKTSQEVDDCFVNFHDVMMGKEGTLPGKLAVLAGVKEYPSRIKCATLAWHAAQAALHNDTENVTTE